MEEQHKNKTLDKKREGERKYITNALMYFYYPNKSNLVINAIISGLHSRENNLVIRATFDFLISHV